MSKRNEPKLHEPGSVSVDDGSKQFGADTIDTAGLEIRFEGSDDQIPVQQDHDGRRGTVGDNEVEGAVAAPMGDTAGHLSSESNSSLDHIDNGYTAGGGMPEQPRISSVMHQRTAGHSLEMEMEEDELDDCRSDEEVDDIDVDAIDMEVDVDQMKMKSNAISNDGTELARCDSDDFVIHGNESMMTEGNNAMLMEEDGDDIENQYTIDSP